MGGCDEAERWVAEAERWVDVPRQRDGWLMYRWVAEAERWVSQ